jgi:hypothetical protein
MSGPCSVQAAEGSVEAWGAYLQRLCVCQAVGGAAESQQHSQALQHPAQLALYDTQFAHQHSNRSAQHDVTPAQNAIMHLHLPGGNHIVAVHALVQRRPDKRT